MDTKAVWHSKRHWYHVHFLTPVLSLIVFIPLFVANFLANDEVLSDYNRFTGEAGLRRFHHGWPLTYSVRDQTLNFFGFDSSWSYKSEGIWIYLDQSHWSPFSNVTRFSAWALLLDAMVTALTVTASAVLFELVRRRRGLGCWQFCLSDSMLTVLGVAILLASGRCVYNCYHKEEIALAELQCEARALGVKGIDTFSCWDGPKWIENALSIEGQRKLEPVFRRIEGVGFSGNQLGDREFSKLVPLLKPFDALKFIYIEHTSITAAGEAEMQKRFPKVEIRGIGSIY